MVKKELTSLERTPAMLMPAGCELVKTGLQIQGHLLFDQWNEIGDNLRKVESGVMWWLGDWLNYGEMEFGEKYSQVLDQTDYSYGTLRNASWVASKVAFVIRNDKLSFSHHAQVADLPEAEQKKWLGRAEKENWSVKELREAIKGPGNPAAIEQKTFTCAKCAAVVLAPDLEAAVERINGSLDPGAKKVKADDLEEWPKEGEFVRFIVEF